MTGSVDRDRLIAERMRDQVWAICKAVPPIQPGAQYWLNSDCGPSYCRDCVTIARGREFELGPLINPSKYSRDAWEFAYFDGIDGGFDCESDNTSACDICGKTLSYILTDCGVASELDYFRESPLVEVRDEDSYALDRLTLNIWKGSKRAQLLAAAAVVNQAWRLIKAAEMAPA